MVVYPIELRYSDPEALFWDEFCPSQSRARSLICRSRELNTESLSIPCSQHDARLHARNWTCCFQRSPSERSKYRSSDLQWDPERSAARNNFRRAGCVYWSRSGRLHRLQGEGKGNYDVGCERAVVQTDARAPRHRSPALSDLCADTRDSGRTHHAPWRQPRSEFSDPELFEPPRSSQSRFPAMGVGEYPCNNRSVVPRSFSARDNRSTERPFKDEQDGKIRMTAVPVVVDSLVKAYKLGRVEVQALRGINLKVEAGGMVSIIGPSGSGKTTLLNILGGLDRATAGNVHVGNTVLTDLDPARLVYYRRQVVGHVFQTLNLIPTLTAAENVELPMMAMGTPGGTRSARTKELLGIVGLADRHDHKPDELSGGEQQRVAIAAALANDPPLLLADEPTGELDSVNAKMVTDFLVKINRELGKTLIMVTHDQNVAKTANNIMRIEDGTIKSSLTPSQIASQDTSSSYLDQLRHRMSELEKQMKQLDDDFRTGKVSGDEYADQRVRLRQVKAGLQDELQRQGVIG